MRRAERLFEIIQILRQASRPITADAIAGQLEVGKRTVYRDIAVLMAQRVPILGESGIGYVLGAGFDMPPLMLTAEEVQAVSLGAQWVIANADPDLARGAEAVLAKVAASIPAHLRALITDPAVATPPRRAPIPSGINYAQLRQWGHRGRKVTITYRDGDGTETRRTIWPFIVGYVEASRVVIAWCELREDFRVFRIDRIVDMEFHEMNYPESAMSLRKKWIRMHHAK